MTTIAANPPVPDWAESTRWFQEPDIDGSLSGVWVRSYESPTGVVEVEQCLISIDGRVRVESEGHINACPRADAAESLDDMTPEQARALAAALVNAAELVEAHQ